MWIRFSEPARLVVFRAQEEAQHLGHPQLETEHLLLGLLREYEGAETASDEEQVWPPQPQVWRGQESLAVCVLRDMDVEVSALKAQAKRQALPSNGTPNKDMQLSANTKRVIDLAYDEARRLKNNYIGTEHLLLGLIREDKGLAGRLLAEQGISLEQARRAVSQLQNGDTNQAQVPPAKKPWWASLFGAHP